MTEINTIEVDGVEYPINMYEREVVTTVDVTPMGSEIIVEAPVSTQKVITFSAIIDGEERGLTVEYSKTLADDLNNLYGINAEEELRNVLTAEIAEEIRRMKK